MSGATATIQARSRLVEPPLALLLAGLAVLVVILFGVSLAVGRAARFCDRLVLLDAGRVVADGAPEAVLNAANLAQVYRMSALRETHDCALYVLPWRRQPGG